VQDSIKKLNKTYFDYYYYNKKLKTCLISQWLLHQKPPI